MERGELGRAEFMSQIRGLTTEIVDKVKGFSGEAIEGDFQPLDAKCPKCGGGPFVEDFRTYQCADCGLRVWKKLADREFERDEVRALLTEGKVGPLAGFRSKMGRTFDAVVKVGEVENDKGEKEWRVTFDFEKNDAGEGGAAFDPATATLLGEAPLGPIYETENAYLFRPTDEKAKPVRMGKVICQRAIPPEQALKVFREGKTDLLPRFISKKGRPFSAYLKLEGGRVAFEFEPRTKKAAVKKAPAKAGA